MREMHFGLIVIGDEILSGKRQDKHLTQVVQLLAERGLSLSWAEYVGDNPERITAVLKRVFASSDAVFCTGGIGATPDDHTRLCAASALGVPAILHPQAKALIEERMQDVAREAGEAFEPDRADNIHRLTMGEFPEGAQIIANSYNKIPGFSCTSSCGAAVHFVPGFPVMAWPMIGSVLDSWYSDLFHQNPYLERSVVVLGQQESALAPMMKLLEQSHPGVAVFSLPSVNHPQYGRHIELGVKGPQALVPAAWEALSEHLHLIGAELGPELVRAG